MINIDIYYLLKSNKDILKLYNLSIKIVFYITNLWFISEIKNN